MPVKFNQDDNVPPPFMSFEATCLPSEFLRELEVQCQSSGLMFNVFSISSFLPHVRYLLRGGAKCRTLCHPPLRGTCIHIFERLHVIGPILIRAFRIIQQVHVQDCRS